MAINNINGTINSSGPVTYTVPGGRQATLNVYGSSSVLIFVNGVQIVAMPSAQWNIKPFCLNAGDVLSANSGAFAYSGQEYY